MIDQIMGARSIERDVLVNPGYSPDQAVLGMHLTDSEEAEKLAVVFPPWHTHSGDKHFDKLTERLVEDGWAVLEIDFNDHVLTPNIDLTLQSYASIQETVPEELHRLVEERGFRNVYGFGASLGNVALGVVAKRFGEFSGATMVVAGSNLAMSMLDGSRTQQLREVLASLGVTGKEIDEAWHDLAPKANAHAFRDKPTQLIISKTDKIIPTTYQREMADALRASGSSVSQKARLMGHYASVGFYCHWGKLPQSA